MSLTPFAKHFCKLQLETVRNQRAVLEPLRATLQRFNTDLLNQRDQELQNIIPTNNLEDDSYDINDDVVDNNTDSEVNYPIHKSFTTSDSS